MKAGFFPSFVAEVSDVIDTKFGDEAMIDVKAIRKAMGIGSKDRSKVMFVAKALQHLRVAGALEPVPSTGAKRYRKARQGLASAGELLELAMPREG